MSSTSMDRTTTEYLVAIESCEERGLVVTGEDDKGNLVCLAPDGAHYLVNIAEELADIKADVPDWDAFLDIAEILIAEGW